MQILPAVSYSTAFKPRSVHQRFGEQRTPWNKITEKIMSLNTKISALNASVEIIGEERPQSYQNGAILDWLNTPWLKVDEETLTPGEMLTLVQETDKAFDTTDPLTVPHNPVASQLLETLWQEVERPVKGFGVSPFRQLLVCLSHEGLIYFSTSDKFISTPGTIPRDNQLNPWFPWRLTVEGNKILTENNFCNTD